MEKELHKPLIVYENDEEEEQLEEHVSFKRTTFPHVKDNNLVTHLVTSSSSSSSSSSSPTSNGHVDSHGVNKVVNHPDGNSLQKEEEVEEKGNVGENNNHLIDDDDKEDLAAVGLGLVAEFAGTITNGEAITSATATFGDDLLQNNNKSVYFDNQQGNEVNGHNTVQNGEAAMSVSPMKSEEIEFDEQEQNSAIQNNLGRQLNDQPIKTEDDKIPSSSELPGLHNSSDIQTRDLKEDNLIEEIDEQGNEYDVEVVIAKQETHDLFCPNCKSCITKRVILKKRKRKIPIIDREEVKHVKFEPVPEIPGLEPPDDSDNRDGDVEGFRCLSCFSIFIPKGNGFNLFRCFGGGSEHETSQNPSSIPAPDLENPSNLPGSSADSNCFSFLFPSKKEKTATQQGDISYEHSGTVPSEQHHSASTTSTSTSTKLSSTEISHPKGPLSETAPIDQNGKTSSDITHGNEVKSVGKESIDFPSKELSLNGKLMANEEDQRNTSVYTTKTNNVEIMSSTSFSDGTVTKYGRVKTSTTSETHSNSGQTAKHGILNPWEEEPEFLEIVNNGGSSSKQGTQSADQSFDSTALAASDIASNNQSSAIDAIFQPKPDITPIEKALQNINESINSSVGKQNKGDVLLTIEEETHESKTFKRGGDYVPIDADITTGSQNQVGIGEQPRDIIGEPRQWEIIKSVVYGGLIESITSLGIVSSAASSGATPLNIIALGFANLIGGLFVLGHNLKDLKNDHYGTVEPQPNPLDRYEEQLGHRRNFLLHVLVALLSFLIFGAVPIVIYGLLINKDYYAEVKLAIVAATSVACIILLSSLKVYTRRPPKSYFRTVLSYVTMAIAASGVSYMAGNLFKDLLEKFYHSESGFSMTMPLSDIGVEKAWTSY